MILNLPNSIKKFKIVPNPDKVIKLKSSDWILFIKLILAVSTIVCLFFPFFYILVTAMISIVVGFGLSIISRELGFPISGLTWFAYNYKY